VYVDEDVYADEDEDEDAYDDEDDASLRTRGVRTTSPSAALPRGDSRGE
jgi:hypothetical protein